MTQEKEDAYVEITEIIIQHHIMNNLPKNAQEAKEGVGRQDVGNLIKEGMQKAENLLTSLLEGE